MEKIIVIKNQVEELPVLFDKIEEISAEWQLPKPLSMNINLVLEEAISNIIFYAFKDVEEHEITISLNLNDKVLTIEIIDDGIAFDPTDKPLPDITLSVEERSIGGLGIFLINQIMDSVLYKRLNNKNILTLIKSIPNGN